MATEYKLPYSGSEINRRLREVDTKISVVALTSAEYEALESTNANTLYSITDDGEAATVDYVDERIGSIAVPTKVSQLENDSKYLTTVPSEYVTDTEMQNYAQPKGNYLTTIPSEYITESELNAKKYLTSYTETDPTVPSWAKATSKPTYTKSEVGLGNVDNVKQYSASNPPPYPVTKVNNKTGAVTLSASDVGADASGTASSAVSAHNTNTAAHSDIRTLISDVDKKLYIQDGTPVDPKEGALWLDTDADSVYTSVYIPVKGTDYWTQADQEAIVQQVITALGTPVFGTVDTDKRITLSTEHLADGTYDIGYEDEDGNWVRIGTLNHTVVPEPTYTNLLPTSLGTNGSVYNGTGYKNGYYLSGSTGEGVDETHFVTGHIPYTLQNARDMVPIYIKGVEIDLSNINTHTRISLYPDYNDASGANPLQFNKVLSSGAALSTTTKLGDKYYKFTPSTNFYLAAGWNNYDMKYFRMSLPGTGEGVIITVNEEIV